MRSASSPTRGPSTHWAALLVAVDGLLYILQFRRLQRSSRAAVRRHVYLQIASTC
jgi:hypothetical protein